MNDGNISSIIWSLITAIYLYQYDIRKIQIEDIKLENLILEKTSGSTDIEVEKLNTDITSGSLEITDSQIDNLVSDGTSGSVKIENITSQVIELEKTSGSVKIKGKCEELDVNSTSGSIDSRLEKVEPIYIKMEVIK